MSIVDSSVGRRSGMRGLGEAAVTPAPVMQPYEEPGRYVLLDRTLTANQELPDLSLDIDGDSDFEWLATAGTKTGEYEIQFRLPSGRTISSARVRGSLNVGTGQFPVPTFPSVRINAGGQIRFSIKDLSGAENKVYIELIGKRILRTAQ